MTFREKHRQIVLPLIPKFSEGRRCRRLSYLLRRTHAYTWTCPSCLCNPTFHIGCWKATRASTQEPCDRGGDLETPDGIIHQAKPSLGVLDYEMELLQGHLKNGFSHKCVSELGSKPNEGLTSKSKKWTHY